MVLHVVFAIARATFGWSSEEEEEENRLFFFFPLARFFFLDAYALAWMYL
jgi:hypothetical protein